MRDRTRSVPSEPALDELEEELRRRDVDFHRGSVEIRAYRFEVSVIASDGLPKYLVVEVAGKLCFPRLAKRDAAEVAAWLAEHCH